MEHREIQPFDKLRTGWQRTEVRRQKSGVKLISDLRLLTSVINDFYDFYGFYDLRFTAYRLRLDEVNRTR